MKKLKKHLKFCVLGLIVGTFCLISNIYAADLPVTRAKQIRTDVTNFDGTLSSADTNVQKALETIDDAIAGAGTGDVTSVGDCTTGACLDGTSDGGTFVSLYDAQGATKLQVGDNAGVVTLTLPNTTGTLIHTETDPTVDTSAEIQAILGAVYLPLTGGTLSDGLTINDNNGAGSTLLTVGDANDADSVQIYGDLTVTGGDITLGTSKIFSGGDTTSLNLIDAIDATTETALEGALDIAGDVSSTGMLTTVIGADTVHDTMIDWGSGANQVDLADIPGGISGANVWDFGGATSVEIPNGTSGTTDATGETYLDTNGDGGTNFSGEVIQVYTGAANKYLFPIALPLAASQDNFIPKYDASTKTISWEADASGGSTAWDDITDPDADGSIDFGSYEQTITSQLDIAAHTVLTITNTDADLANAVTLLKLTYTDDGQANGTFLDCLDNASGDSKFKIGVDGNTTIAGTLNVTGAITGSLTGTASGNATKALDNLASVAINTSLLSDTAATDDLGTEALYWRKLYLGSDISFEGATDDAYQTTLTAVDTTLSDKSINIPNASGTMAVSATAPITLSALGDIGITVLKDLVTTAPLTGGTNDILVGADADITLALTTGIADTNAVVINAADVADNDYAKFTATGLEGRSYSEVLGDIGAQAADADLTTYAGITPSANAQTLLGETFAQMQASMSIDDLITLSGVAEGSVNLATFTGSTIADNVTIKAALQALETAVEGKQATVTEGSLADSTIISADIKDGTIAGGDLATNIAITTTGLITANGNLKVGNAAATSGVLTLLEDTDDGSDYASFQVPALAGNTVYTLPPDDGDAGEQLQTNGSGVLTWEAAGAGSATAWDDIGDPDADATIAFAGYEEDITSTLDAAGKTVLTITNTDADRANATTILTLADNDGADAEAKYLEMIGDADGTPTTDYSFTQTGFTSLLPVNVPAEAYDATNWDADTGAPQKDAIRDKLEAMPQTAGDALTLTGTDMDFDGGASPGGELGGTWASPTIDDSVAVTSWNLTTPTITTSLTTSTPTTLSAAELDRLDGLTSAIIDDDKIDTMAELDTIVADENLLCETEIDASSELAALMDDETGTAGKLVFDTSPTFTTSIALNADPADTGAIRLSNADYIYSEAAPAGTDVSVIGVDSAEAIQIGASGASGVTITPTLTVGVLSGTIDMGGATSTEIPNGANPATDAAGEIAVDTSAAPGSGIRFYGDAAYTLAGTYSKSFVILNPVATDDYPVWRTPYALTIKAVHVQSLGGTNIIGQLSECDANGINCAVCDSADITAAANNNANDDGTLSNPSIDANDYIGWITTSISGTPTSVTVTFDYIVNQTN